MIRGRCTYGSFKSLWYFRSWPPNSAKLHAYGFGRSWPPNSAKLHAYGFGKDALTLIKSYLSDRKQRAKINTSHSSWATLLSCVPQGSVVGPLLFNFYINDIFYLIIIDIYNYADDNTLYTIDMCLEKLMAKLERAANSAMEWLPYMGWNLFQKNAICYDMLGWWCFYILLLLTLFTFIYIFAYILQIFNF